MGIDQWKVTHHLYLPDCWLFSVSVSSAIGAESPTDTCISDTVYAASRVEIISVDRFHAGCVYINSCCISTVFDESLMIKSHLTAMTL